MQDMATQMGSMGAVSTLFAVVDRIASATAAVDWRLWRQAPSGKPEDRTLVTAHPALTVWDNPNRFYTQRELVETITQHYDLTGEWWLVVGRVTPAGTPVELWPVRPDRMRPVPDKDTFISGYVYRGTVDVPLGVDQVITKKRPNPLDPYRGISPAGSLLYDLRGEQAAAEWNAQFFANSARPDGVLETPATLSDPEFTRLTDQWREAHQGPVNAHRVALLEAGLHFNPVGWAQKDMDFVALRGFSKEQILQAYGLSKFMLGAHEGVNRATAIAAKAVFYEQTINPRLDLLKEALNRTFLPMFGALGRGVEFDYDNPEPEDSDAQRAELSAAVSAAATMIGLGFDPGEVLAAFGLPDLTMIGVQP